MVDYVVCGKGAAASDADLTDGFVEHVLQRHRQEQGR